MLRGLCRLSSGEGPGLEDNLGVVSLGDIYSPGSNDITAGAGPGAAGSAPVCLSQPRPPPVSGSPGVKPTGHWEPGRALIQATKRAVSVHCPRLAAGLPGRSWPSSKGGRPATGQWRTGTLQLTDLPVPTRSGQGRAAPGAWEGQGGLAAGLWGPKGPGTTMCCRQPAGLAQVPRQEHLPQSIWCPGLHTVIGKNIRIILELVMK